MWSKRFFLTTPALALWRLSDYIPDANLAMLLCLLILTINRAAASLPCELSGYCSIGKTRAFFGDIANSESDRSDAFSGLMI
jgi:hypothetical protein